MFALVDGVKRYIERRDSLETIDGDNKNRQNVYLSDTATSSVTFLLPATTSDPPPPPDTIAIGMSSSRYSSGELVPSYGKLEAGRGMRACNDTKHPEIHQNRWWKLILVRSNADHHEVHIMHHLSDASAPLYLGLIEGRPTLTVTPTAWYISTSAEIPPMSWRLPPLPV